MPLTQLREAVEKLHAIPLSNDLYAFRGDSGAWYTLPYDRIKDVSNVNCILDLKPEKMPDGWAPSWKVEVDTGEAQRSSNAVRLPTKEEAEGYGADIQRRWTLVRGYAVVESDASPNYIWATSSEAIGYDRLVALDHYRCLDCELPHDPKFECGYAALMRLEAKRKIRESYS